MESGRKSKRRNSIEAIYNSALPGGVDPQTPAHSVHSGSTHRDSVFPSKSDKRPVAVLMFSFYRELKSVCTLKPAVECHYPCIGTNQTSMDDEQMAGLQWLQSLAEEGNLEELQFQLFMREIQRINPTLEQGCLFVDGLYELVCSRMPMDARATDSSPLRSSARDLLTVHNSGTLLLQQYWLRPDSLDQHTAYLTVASSFVEYVLSKYGPEGISQFLRKLDSQMVDPQDEDFHFKGKNILALELKWKKFVEAQVNKKFRLSIPGMLKMLFQQYLLTYWFRLLVVFLTVIAEVALYMLFSISTAKLVSLGYGSTGILPILQWTGTLLGTILAIFVLLIISTILLASISVNVSNMIRKQLSVRLHSVSPKFLNDHSASSILSTFAQDVSSIEIAVVIALRTVAWGLLMLLAFITFILVKAWPLGIPLTFVYVASQLMVNFVSSRLSDHAFAKSQATNKLCDIIKEKIDGFAVNRLYNLGDFWQFQLGETIRLYYSPKAKRSLFLSNFILLFQQMVPRLLLVLVLFGAVILAKEDYLHFDDGLALFVFYSMVAISLIAASAMFPHVSAAATAMGRINALLNNELHSLEKKAGPTGDDSSPLEENDCRDPVPVEFRDVCFSYDSAASHWNLFDVSLRIEAGERVALVGTSGSGKSTLLSLVLQMFKPVHGEVIIGEESGGTPKVAATFQHNHIFAMSIRENIRIGNLEATDEEVEEAARLADIHTWITSLPRGYDTTVQLGGNTLSGGQKQRIAIARMLVAEAPVLVLDEVTSALDPPTESRVFEKLMEVTREKTVIAVTHRLAQARQFDRIVVLSHGKVKEVGTHEELIAAGGTYWQMWNNETSTSPPGKAVPIVRRRSLHEAPPDLSIVPISAARSTPALFLQSGVATPTFTPLRTVIETGESSRESNELSRVTTDPRHPPPPASARTLSAIATSPIPVNASTPKDGEPLQNQEAGEDELQTAPVEPIVIVVAHAETELKSATSQDSRPEAELQCYDV